MSDTVLTEERLIEIAGLRGKARPQAALRRALRKAGIPFRELGGRITTTEEAFTATLVGRAKKKKTGINWDGIDD